MNTKAVYITGIVIVLFTTTILLIWLLCFMPYVFFTIIIAIIGIYIIGILFSIFWLAGELIYESYVKKY